jgi:transcriptional regulator with XRE-family HTH domain
MLIHTINSILKNDNISLRKLSSELNCSHSWLSQVLSGKRESNLQLLREVSRYTGKSYDYLMQVHTPINESKIIDIELLKELFDRRKTSTPQRHIKPLAKRPSYIEQKIIDNIRQCTDFDFNQVTLNYNHQMQPHRHKNQGISQAILIGEFTGGALCVEDGSKFDNVNEWFNFNGTLNHWVEPFEGERYSVIIYNR